MCGCTFFKPAHLPCHADQIIDRTPRHRLPALGNEKPRQLVGARGEIAFDRPQLVAGDRLLDRQRIFQTLHPHTRLREVHLVAPQSDRFAHPQPVPVHHQHQQVIARSVSAALRRIEQLLHLGFVEKILAALVRVGGLPHPRFRPTLYISPLGRTFAMLRKPASPYRVRIAHSPQKASFVKSASRGSLRNSHFFSVTTSSPRW